jgi:hypothetical protein
MSSENGCRAASKNSWSSSADSRFDPAILSPASRHSAQHIDFPLAAHRGGRRQEATCRQASRCSSFVRSPTCVIGEIGSMRPDDILATSAGANRLAGPPGRRVQLQSAVWIIATLVLALLVILPVYYLVLAVLYDQDRAFARKLRADLVGATGSGRRWPIRCCSARLPRFLGC